MKETLFAIKQRLSRPWLLVPWAIFRLKQLLKVDFNLGRGEYDQVPLDLVIVTIDKDFPIMPETVAAVRANLRHPINKIFMVSRDSAAARELSAKLGCVFIDETSYLPVKKEDLDFVVQGWHRGGWILQQLLKFGADNFVTTENFLVLESDTVLLNPVGFIEGGKLVFGASQEWNPPYFEAFFRLFGFRIKYPLSYIVQMMIFNVPLLKECKNEMEVRHKKPWYEAYASVVDRAELSSIADYENYAHWVYCKYPSRVVNKVFYNVGLSRKFFGPWQALKAKYGHKYNSVSFHSYLN